MPRHVNPIQHDRTATAPYNFIPLPEEIFTVQEGIDQEGKLLKPWEQQDEFALGTSSGWIDLKITTLTPLFIRDAIRQIEQNWDERENRVRPEPYSNSDGRPVIPGTTLRGAIRTLVEILSFSKIRPVNRSKPFFRSVANDRIGNVYRRRMIQGEAKPRGGFVQISTTGSVSIIPCDVVRVDRSRIKNKVLALKANEKPAWLPEGQQCSCWVKISRSGEKVDGIDFQRQPQGWLQGVLVLTGWAPRKNKEFVFLHSKPTSHLRIPESIWQRFHDNDQVTQWQEDAFPRDKPTNNSRERSGALRDGEPVFFIANELEKNDSNPDGLVFLGRAQLFRLPYDLSPEDLVPEHLRKAPTDLAEAIFGCVRPNKNSDLKTFKGRVFFEDAIACDGGPNWKEEILVPSILSDPKPTSFQHYLTQNGDRQVRDLKTYFKDDDTTIRGHKLYWHRRDVSTESAEVREPNDHSVILGALGNNRESQHTQHTIIQPLRTGVRFNSRVRFENLTDAELGALLTAIELPEGCAHKIGMGKPLGLGSIRIETKLRVINRGERYLNWENSGSIELTSTRFRNAFERAILTHARASKEAINDDKQGIRQISRLDALYIMLEWQKPPNNRDTAAMKLEKFRGRPVLPTPHRVAGYDEPSWHKDPPRISSPDVESQNNGTVPSTSDLRPVQTKIKPVQKGQTRPGTLHSVGDRWIARFEGEHRDAEIINSNKIPGDAKDTMKAEFHVRTQSKDEGIQVRFQRKL